DIERVLLSRYAGLVVAYWPGRDAGVLRPEGPPGFRPRFELHGRRGARRFALSAGRPPYRTALWPCRSGCSPPNSGFSSICIASVLSWDLRPRSPGTARKLAGGAGAAEARPAFSHRRRAIPAGFPLVGETPSRAPA